MADCTELQAQYAALSAAYMDLLTGKRQVVVKYGDKEVTYGITSANALKEARDEVAAALKSQCGVNVMGAAPSRIAQPSMGSGRC